MWRFTLGFTFPKLTKTVIHARIRMIGIKWRIKLEDMNSLPLVIAGRTIAIPNPNKEIRVWAPGFVSESVCSCDTDIIEQDMQWVTRVEFLFDTSEKCK
jgi:hypothetical protein